jgi:N12 class adenine-specific DNA methylase/SAM-dependent methyltransferase
LVTTTRRGKHDPNVGQLSFFDFGTEAPTAAPPSPPSPAAAAFTPASQDDLAPSGTTARVRANLAAIRALRDPATPDRLAVMARYSGWGAAPEVFDDRPTKTALALRWAREELETLLTEAEFRAANATILNAHYTDLAYVKAIWACAQRLGFSGGDVLEPGCGTGNFIGVAPGGADLTGVELDPVTAAIAAALYPSATVVCDDFTAARFPENSFSLVVGNVPFGDIQIPDKAYNPDSRHSIHNHCLIKALHLLQPGGVLIAFTSRYTMDARSPAARREMADLADLLGAVRLPSGAHQRAAGTKVVTDVLVLRRRETGISRRETDWERAPQTRIGEHDVDVNQWFLDHPEFVIGEMRTGDGGGMHRDSDLHVAAPDGDIAVLLRDALNTIADQAKLEGLHWAPAPEDGSYSPAPEAGPAAALAKAAGYITDHGNGRFTIVEDGWDQPFTVPATQAAELSALLGIRDIAVALLDAQAATAEDTPGMLDLRARLNQRYDAYVRGHGVINRFTQRRTGRYHGTCPSCETESRFRKTDVDALPSDFVMGEERPARTATCPDCGASMSVDETLSQCRPAQGGFRRDPYATLVQALEIFDAEDQSAGKADIFTVRVVSPRRPKLGADTPDEALAICLDTHGRVDLGEITRLLGCEPGETRDRLGDLVFEIPPRPAPGYEVTIGGHKLTGADLPSGEFTAEDDQPGTLVPRAEYLSGRTRARLRAAEAAAEHDPAFDVNVQALRKVTPRDLTPGEIDARMGAPWIHARYVRRFLAEILEDPGVSVQHPGGQVWVVRGDTHSVLARTRWGTDRVPATSLAQSVLRQRPIQVYDTVDVPNPDGPGMIEKRIFNPDATLAAQEKAAEMRERFAEWVWADAARAAELAAVYNWLFNTLVPRSYDDASAETMTLPGLSDAFTPHAHQYPPVARAIHEPASGFFHEVGAGKTAEGIIAVMELRRLGLISKAAVVVPNSVVDGFAREWQRTYPLARVLVGTEDDLAGKEKRRRFVARCATGDWDAVVIAMSAFERIQMTRDAQEAYLCEEVSMYEKWMRASADAGDSMTAKALQKTIQRIRLRILAKMQGKTRDRGLCFEGLGVDFLVVDEMQNYKNLRTPSAIPDAAIDGSERATDLAMKLHWLRSRGLRRILIGMTATPIANSITETHVMCRYMRPDLLEAAGVEVFDSWVATFGEVVSGIELAPEGGKSYRIKSRLARFGNVQELHVLWKMFADVKLSEDLDLQVPLIAERPGDNARDSQIVQVQPSAGLEDYVYNLGERAKAVREGRVEPEDDNMLKICTDGRKASLSLNLVGGEQDGPTKIDEAADRIYDEWVGNRGNVYPGSALPGGFQLVFCDLGTPSAGRWNVYDTLRAELVRRGMPGRLVQYAQTPRNARERAAQHAACRNGRIAVLIGSTAIMGVGVNVQDRCVALHELDAPWRPDQVTQRVGRAIRQGNLNKEVRLYRYVMERSFDAYMWQILARKAVFIAQLMRGRFDSRSVDDIGDQALSFAEVRALATGNPLLLEQAAAAAELTKLERGARAHGRTQEALRYAIKRNTEEVTYYENQRAETQTAIARRKPVTEETFEASVGGVIYEDQAEADDALRTDLEASLDDFRTRLLSDRKEITSYPGWFAGFQVVATTWFDPRKGATRITLTLKDAPRASIELNTVDVRRSPLFWRLMRVLDGLETLLASSERNLDRARQEIERAQQDLGSEYAHRDELLAARAKADRLNAELARLAREEETRNRQPAAAAA